MATWKKVIVSGSNAELNSVSITTDASITGSLTTSGSVYLKGLSNNSATNIVSIDPTTGQLSYQGTGSFTANSASYATSASQAENANSASYATSASHAVNADTASYVNTLNQAVVISGSLSVNTTTGNSFDINADTFAFTGSLSTTGSVSFALPSQSANYVVEYDPTTGLLSYVSTGSLSPATASYAESASQAVSASYAISASQATSASFAVSASYLKGDSINVNAIYPTSSNAANRIFLESDGMFAGPVGSLVLYSSTTPLILNAGSGTSAVQITGSLELGQGGATGSFSGSFHGDGSGLTGVTASSAFALSQSTGITAFNYDGSSSATVAISGAADLTNNNLTKWDSAGKFITSSITDSVVSGVVIDTAQGVTIQQGGLYVTGSSTFHDNVTIQGDLTVAGTASFQHANNLAIADQFILLNSGSATFQDSGFVINTGNSGNSGSAFFLETSNTTSGTASQNGRFAVAGNVQPNATTVTAEEYATTTLITGSAPNIASIPQFGGNLLGHGNMWVDSFNGEIYIYA
jgi:hypothetical protein